MRVKDIRNTGLARWVEPGFSTRYGLESKVSLLVFMGRLCGHQHYADLLLKTPVFQEFSVAHVRITIEGPQGRV